MSAPRVIRAHSRTSGTRFAAYPDRSRLRFGFHRRTPMRVELMLAATLAFALAAPAGAQLPPDSPTGRGVGGSSSGRPDSRVERRAEPAKPSDIAPSASTPAAAAPAPRNGSKG